MADDELFQLPDPHVVTKEEYSGIRLKNRQVNHKLMDVSMAGRKYFKLPELDSVSRRFQRGKLSADSREEFLTIGAVCQKSAVKTSAKGGKYVTWTLTDLHMSSPTTVKLLLFDEAFATHGSADIGSVFVVFSPKFLSGGSRSEFLLQVSTVPQLTLLGTAADLGTCRAKKKDGTRCSVAINTTGPPYCEFHIGAEYKRMRQGRGEFGAMSGDVHHPHQSKHFSRNAPADIGASRQAPAIRVATARRREEANKVQLEKEFQEHVSTAGALSRGQIMAGKAAGVKVPTAGGPISRSAALRMEKTAAVKARIEADAMTFHERKGKVLLERTKAAVQRANKRPAPGLLVVDKSPPRTKPAARPPVAARAPPPPPRAEPTGKLTAAKKRRLLEQERLGISKAPAAAKAVTPEARRKPPKLSRKQKALTGVVMRSGPGGSLVTPPKAVTGGAGAGAKAAADTAKREAIELEADRRRNLGKAPLPKEKLKRPTFVGLSTEPLARPSAAVQQTLKVADSVALSDSLARLHREEMVEEKVKAVHKVQVKVFVCETCKTQSQRLDPECRPSGHRIRQKEVDKYFWECTKCHKKLARLGVATQPFSACSKCSERLWKRSTPYSIRQNTAVLTSEKTGDRELAKGPEMKSLRFW